jgi:hypothetical protein
MDLWYTQSAPEVISSDSDLSLLDIPQLALLAPCHTFSLPLVRRQALYAYQRSQATTALKALLATDKYQSEAASLRASWKAHQSTNAQYLKMAKIRAELPSVMVAKDIQEMARRHQVFVLGTFF